MADIDSQGAAAQAGVQRHDAVLALNGVDCTDITDGELVEVLTKGSAIDMTTYSGPVLFGRQRASPMGMSMFTLPPPSQVLQLCKRRSLV